ncbi:SET domain-containing protein-lysine N-methyltransferase [Actinoplanes sp. NPDC023801]|uniref:SET domain-containing protein-lysine N-methyltransferase n=1 Tax=Actinoplanes sp. NPDC023801 TaxID=3154595 RepID=UPI0033C2E9DD
MPTDAVNDVTLGPGSLAGNGVYAARDFAAGEVVVSYRLQPLDEAAYLALPAGEELFVHSYGGRRYLYPPPARFVNHSDDPSCCQDFERGCDIALRPIARGEPVTIDATEETARELDTFLDAYLHALRERSGRLLAALIDRDAVLWMAGRAVRGRDAFVTAVAEAGPVSLSEVEWFVGTGRWEALCSADARTAKGRRHQSLLLKVIRGNWQIVYHHAG